MATCMADDAPSTTPDEPAGQASSELLARFAQRLIALARLNLDARLRNKVDPEDVVQSVYKSFFLRYGDLPMEEDENGGLWALLALITLRKCADRVRYYETDRRNLAREAVPAGSDANEPWREVVGREPTPEHAAMLTETLERLLIDVDAADRPMLELSLQGYSTQEISEQLGRAERSVRRFRERVRKQLERMQLDSAL
jgi:RNA polymerase sigma-70 factor (ECF subfamily)